MSGRPSIWFITPAWKRYKISEITFAQRAWMLDQLWDAGIDADACVIADDENLDLARAHGFAVIDRPNDFLGAKFNDGYQFAAEQGVDYVCPIGSDSWLDPGFIIDYFNEPRRTPLSVAPKLPRSVVYSQHYAVVRTDGRERAQLLVKYEGGTTMFYPTSALAQAGYRPIPDRAQRGCDGHTIAAIRDGGSTRFVVRERHKLETVSFQSELQVTNYALLIQRWGVGQTDRPFDGLADHYPAELVERVKAFYKDRQHASA